MVANPSHMTPNQLAVFEVYRRLRDAALPEPTLSTVAELAKLKEPTAKLSCEQLAAKGILVRGGRSKHSYQIPVDCESHRGQHLDTTG